MPIISQIGRKKLPTRLLLTGVYLVLIAGGVTMAYPFLLMLATATTGTTDFTEYRVIPRYYYDVEARYVKFVHEKYQQVRDHSDLHGTKYRLFNHIPMPTYRGDPSPATSERIDKVTDQPLPPRVVIEADYDQIVKRVEPWRRFQQTLGPLEFGLWHVGAQNLPGKAELLWRDWCRDAYGSVDAACQDMSKDLIAFSDLFAPYEEPMGKLWPGVHGAEGRQWRRFKADLDPRYRRPVDGQLLWLRYLRFKYTNVDMLNEKLGLELKTISEWALPARRPDGKAAKAWDFFVRHELPFRFVEITEGDAAYRKFLLDNYRSVDELNKQLGSAYGDPKDIRWPPQQVTTNELRAVSLFLQTASDTAEMEIVTPDKRYGAFLKREFGGDLGKLNDAFGASLASFDHARPPYEEEDLWEYGQDKSQWNWWFLTRNFAEVIDYMAVRGRALWNTLILVGAMVLCALTVNPLAAYALSRFRLSYTNQLLLFLLATMAFPYEVAMIPNFLLLRRFPLWTWVVGLAVGLVVAGIVVRATRGRARWLALPAALGAAGMAGFYLTPLIGRMFGLDVGPISLLNTFSALILPRVANGYSIFLLKGFFDSLPEELFEAGRIDGAGEMRMLWQIAFPLCKPIFAVLALHTFTAIYGSYIWALLVCQDERMWTLMVHIFQLQQWAPAHVTMAATALASIPTLIVFILAQKVIMKGIIIPTYK